MSLKKEVVEVEVKVKALLRFPYSLASTLLSNFVSFNHY